MSALLDYEDIAYDELINGGQNQRIHSMQEVVQEVFERSRKHEAWSTAGETENAAKLDAQRTEIVLDEITKRTTDLLGSCPHSRQYWYQLLRRSAPLLWQELQTISKADGIPSWFAEVTKGAGHLVLASSADGDPWEWIEEGEKKGIDYRGLSQKELLVAAQIFSLAQLRYEAQVRYRFACKGFRVFAKADEDDALSSQDTSSIKRYEERRSKYDTFAGSAGLWCDCTQIAPVRKDLCHWIESRTAVANHFILRSENPASEFYLQYLLTPFFEKSASSHEQAFAENESGVAASLVPYDRLIEHPDLRLAFESAVGFESEQVVAFLYSVFRLIYTFLRFPRLDYKDDKTIQLVWVDEPVGLREKVLHHWRDAGIMNLLRSNRDDWIERLQIESAHVHDSEDSVPALDKNQIKELVDKFTWTSGMPPYSNTPLLFTQLSSHTLVLDGYMVGDFLRHVLLSANVVSKDKSSRMYGRDLTGAWLEAQATLYFTRKLGLAPHNVIQSRKVQRKREIDIAFVKDKTLFVIECKAMAKDAGFIMGQHQRIRNRHSEMRNELEEKNPQRVDLIRQGLVSDVIAPDSFDRAYGLVCTPAVEYLPLENEVFWLNDVPLVGPPEELVNSIRVLSK